MKKFKPNFKIPKGYRRRFIIQLADGSFQEELLFESTGIYLRDRGQGHAGMQSCILDWIQESIEAVRTELETKKK